MASKATSKAASKQKRSMRLVRFMKNVWAELKKVSWPNRTEMITYTTVVVISVALVAVILWIFDSIFSFLLSFVL